jgi:hypothetical protein
MSPLLVYLSSIHHSHIIWKHVSSTMWTFPYDLEESAIRNPWHIYLSCLSRLPADQEVSEWYISLIFLILFIFLNSCCFNLFHHLVATHLDYPVPKLVSIGSRISWVGVEVSHPNFPHFILSIKLLPSVNLFCLSLKVSSQTVQRYHISVWSVKKNSSLDLSLCILPLSRFCLFDQKQTHSSRNILSGHQNHLSKSWTQA